VLPTIAPDLDYANLGDVADGTAAQLVYLEMVHRDTAEERRHALAEALRVYCRRDAEGMVRIAQHFLAPINQAPLTEAEGCAPIAHDVIS
jgi:hypothetical protein